MQEIVFWVASGFAGGIVFASFFEWALHRFLMHKPLFQFRYPFERHALIHHRIFKADHTYHLVDTKDKALIPMAWWNGPVLVLACQLPFVIWASLSGHWILLAGSTVSCGLYYAAYEYMHWCMHLPKERRLEKSYLFYRLNGHHLLHHRYMNKNFNVVLPLADLCLGTLLLRSRIRFAQASGTAVPNVQPRELAAETC
jgi:hypothetical protein